MLKSYLKIAYRNLIKNKVASFINIAGLSVGLAVAILIGLWIWSEFSFDKNFTNYNSIAQVNQHLRNNGEIQTQSNVPYPLAAELRKNYGSDFKYVVLAAGGGKILLSHGDKKLMPQGIYFEPDAPEMLSLTMLQGTRKGLTDPSSVMLSQSTAKAFFGEANPMNELMTIGNKQSVKVTGIYADLLQNSSFADVGFMAPWDLYFNNSWVKNETNPWRPNAFAILTQLVHPADIDAVSLKIKDAKLRNVNADLAKKNPALFLQPMSKWHLYAEFKNGVNTGGSIQYVWMFGIIGVFVLLLACINFMNLSTARSEKRAREVGIRKAIGSLRRQLIYQFLSESLLMVTLAFIIALLLAQLALPFFNQVANKNMAIPWSQPVFWLLCLGFSCITGLLAGSYPAFYLSSFQPIKVLKGTLQVGTQASIPRKVLVVVQFAVSIVLIIGTLVVLQQIKFSRNRPIGYDRNGLIAIPMTSPTIHQHFAAVKQELTNSGAITAMAESESSTTSSFSTSSGFNWPGKDPNIPVDFLAINVSIDYGKTVGWQFTQGRDFSAAFASDSTGLVLNESALHYMNLKNPIGATVTWFGEPYHIVGVVKDMVMQSPYEPVKPAVFDLTSASTDFVIVKVNPAMNAAGALQKIETVFKNFNPEQPFEYQFADAEYAKKFGDEERVGKLAGFFAVLAIFISCLGLFGMASFVAALRTKEIGVRKVLGASVLQLWYLLSREFVILVAISFFIAAPVAYFFMHQWLQNYSYRTTIPFRIFIAASGGAMLITILTVSYQTIKAALMNPIKSLRTE